MVITFLLCYNFPKNEAEDIEKYREIEIANVKQALRNQVDIAYAMIESNRKHSVEDQDYLENFYGHRLKNIIEVVEKVVIKPKLAEVTAGRLRHTDAQTQAIAEIKQIRYDNGKGYIWINDTREPFPQMIMHPTIPLLDGQILDGKSYNNAEGGKNLFVAFVEVCKKKGEGYVKYEWPKPTPDGLTHDEHKLSYVKLVEEWNWVIGTGIYIDDAIAHGRDKIISEFKKVRYDNGVGYFWINDITKPTPKMVMHPTIPALDGTVLDDPKFNTTLGKYTNVSKGKNLFEAFVEVCEQSETGSGYVDYTWPKPTETGLTEPQPKMSYVRLYEPFGWIIGSGVYIDHIEKEIEKRQKKIF